MTISYPKESSKFDLAAELFWRLKGLGFLVSGEVKARAEAGRCKFDLVAFNPLTKAPLAIIEVEPPRKVGRPITALADTKRVRKYKSFGIKIYVCDSYSGIEEVVGALLA